MKSGKIFAAFFYPTKPHLNCLLNNRNKNIFVEVSLFEIFYGHLHPYFQMNKSY